MSRVVNSSWSLGNCRGSEVEGRMSKVEKSRVRVERSRVEKLNYVYIRIWSRMSFKMRFLADVKQDT